MNADHLGIGVWAYHEVIFQVVIGKQINKIDSWVYSAKADPLEMGDLSPRFTCT